MIQIISGFTEEALHRLSPLLSNLSSPWCPPDSHGSTGKRVCNNPLLFTHTHTHGCTYAPIQGWWLKRVKTESERVLVAWAYAHAEWKNLEMNADKSARGKMN